MNWKLSLIGLCLVVGIFARPADETPQVKVEATTTAQLAVETTNLTEKSITEALKETTTVASKPKTDAPTTVRYLQQLNLNQQTKLTNSRSKYANNYANLITKHTLNRQTFVNNTKGNSKLTVDNLSFNVTSSIGGNKINANESAMPTISSSSSVTSNSSSRPLVFVDADVTTTKRAFIALNSAINTWPNYNLEESGTFPPIKKKPIIHKIISKWSDNPHDVFDLHAASNQEPFISSQQAQITELSNQLVQSAFNNRIPTTSTNVLPLTIGQQLIHEHQHIASTSASTRKPVKKISSRKPIVISSTVNNLLMNVKKPTKAPTKNNCLIKIGNKVISNYDDCKRYQIDNKIDSTKYHSSQEYDDSPVGFQVETEPDFPTAPGGGNPSIPSGGIPGGDVPSARPSSGSYPAEESNKGKHKKKNKNKQGGTDVGSMVITMMTMMAVFNPLNFGVWGIAFAPMAAMLLGGACFAMYHYMNYHPKPVVWHAPHHHHQPWQKGQEIVIRNKIKHSAIPIKVTHLHKHTAQPQSHQHSHGPPVHEYSPPWESYDAIKSFGEPPSDYFPSAPNGGPYTRRKSNVRKRVQRPTNPFRFKLL